MNVFLLPSRARQDRKSRSDRITECQNWQDINSENAMNEIEPIESSLEVVDGREKVRQASLRLLLVFCGQTCSAYKLILWGKGLQNIITA